MASQRAGLNLESLSLRESYQSTHAVFKYRDRITILIDILRAIQTSQKGKTKTQILQSANLSYPQLNKYLHLLLINGFLHDDNGVYRVTSEGTSFASILESFNLRLL